METWSARFHEKLQMVQERLLRPWAEIYAKNELQALAEQAKQFDMENTLQNTDGNTLDEDSYLCVLLAATSQRLDTKRLNSHLKVTQMIKNQATNILRNSASSLVNKSMTPEDISYSDQDKIFAESAKSTLQDANLINSNHDQSARLTLHSFPYQLSSKVYLHLESGTPKIWLKDLKDTSILVEGYTAPAQ